MNAIASSLATPLALRRPDILAWMEPGLARVLLLLAHFGKDGQQETVIPKMSQETLAEMMGTTRVADQFFHESLRKLGFIDFDGGIGLQVHSSLLNIVLHD